MNEPYRFACPKDHRALNKRGGSTANDSEYTHWYCRTCRGAYNRVTDLKTGKKVAP